MSDDTSKTRSPTPNVIADVDRQLHAVLGNFIKRHGLGKLTSSPDDARLLVEPAKKLVPRRLFQTPDAAKK